MTYIQFCYQLDDKALYAQGMQDTDRPWMDVVKEQQEQGRQVLKVEPIESSQGAFIRVFEQPPLDVKDQAQYVVDKMGSFLPDPMTMLEDPQFVLMQYLSFQYGLEKLGAKAKQHKLGKKNWWDHKFAIPKNHVLTRAYLKVYADNKLVQFVQEGPIFWLAKMKTGQYRFSNRKEMTERYPSVDPAFYQRSPMYDFKDAVLEIWTVKV